MPDPVPKRRDQRTPNGCLTVTGWALTHQFQSGTLKGCPNPPAMVRGEQSSPAPHASFTLGLALQGAFDTRWVTYRILTGTFDSNVAAMTI